MNKEIELKSHISDWKALLEKLRKSPNISEEKYGEKEDVYFFNPILEQNFRVRRETFNSKDDLVLTNTIFTSKEKIIADGIETNTEVELDLSYESFEKSIHFFESLGFKQIYRKFKKGYSFLFSYFDYPLNIELLEVDPLGWFFEIEFVVDKDADTTLVELLINNLYETLDIFNIPHSSIEKQYYAELLGKL